MSSRSVLIAQGGRSGSVVYREGGRELQFYWEFGGGDVVASVMVGTEAEWRAQHAWALKNRLEILRFVADEVVRQTAPTCTAEMDEPSGWMHFRQTAAGARANAANSSTRGHAMPQSQDAAFVHRLSALKARLGIAVFAVALLAAGIVWFQQNILVVRPGPATPMGLVVRTDAHFATLVESLEPYTPSLHRDHSKDRYTVGVVLFPIDGSPSRSVTIASGLPGGSYSLAKILGSDGRTLWFDVNGTGGVDLSSFALVRGAPSNERGLQGAGSFPFTPSVDENLASGFFTRENEWLGLLSPAEMERGYGTKHWLGKITNAENAKQQRRFYRGETGDTSTTGSRRILSMKPLGEAEYLNAAFLRLDGKSEPLRLANPDGALMVFTSEPGLRGTTVVARVDTSGNFAWKVDTAIDRFHLQQILPGRTSFAFVGTRVPVPDKLSEPLLVVVDNATGRSVTHSLWRP